MRALERSQADEAISRLQAALTDTDDRHASLAREWSVECELLLTKLARTEEEKADLANEIGAEQANKQTALETAGREYQQSLESVTEEHARLERGWHATCERYEADVITSRTERCDPARIE